MKIRDCIQQKNEWKGAELSAMSMGKFLHKVFKTIVNELNNTLPSFEKPGSEVSHFIS